ncbi:response regulator transcription factor [Flectobacillus sp. DC10W]|jgi:DNA-binding response OmpR family regulator|uniref:Response regulator transcription factor n=1 Tax=Flectobacillus longus TaxID=2984207 RepID=A0ABT6YGH6_9BACT|nr:response regulator transcription factor [Flectobacillus longus]MDI9862697.1 response regulator transcription factor [Flectobacillus longus]
MKVLIAEDEPLLRKLLIDKFSRNDCTVISAENGLDAIESFDNLQPDVVITDLNMPYAGGQELILHIRESKFAGTPILVLSGTSNEHTINDVFRLGANDFVEKPFRMNELLLRAQRLIHLN